MTGNRPANGGFSLLETLVAAAIVAVAFSVAFSGIATTARGTERISDVDARIDAARSILAGIDLIERIGPGDRAEGITPDGFTWRVETRDFIPAVPGRPLAVIAITLEIGTPGTGDSTWSVPSYKTVLAPDTAPPLEEQLAATLGEQR